MLRFRPWQLAALLILVCGAVLGFLYFQRKQAQQGNAWLFTRLPASDAVVVAIDVKLLRDAGVLDLVAGSRTAEELDYKDFIAQTGFDYRDDLDFVAGSFQKGQKYFLLRGRFRWKQLRDYAAAHQGKCINAFCEVPGNRPDRKVSFFPAAPDVMAISIGESPAAAWNLAPDSPPRAESPLPVYPLWVRVDADALRNYESLPAGLRSFTSALGGAETVVLGFGGRDGQFEASLEANFPSEERAAEIRTRLQEVTQLLNAMFARQKQTPSPNDLSGVLSSGTFEASGKMLRGRWLLERAFLEALSEGKI